MTSDPAAHVIGLDLSLTTTGIAGRDWTRLLKPPATIAAAGGLTRLRWITEAVRDHIATVPAGTLVAVEGPSYGSAAGQQGHHERAGLWWMVYDAVDRDHWPIAVIPPASLKRYATGKGNASKDAVLLAAAKRFPWFGGDNNQADALWLAAMAADHLGHPIATMPATHRAALDGVTWPETGNQ